jgi:hypothetical protein
MTPTERIQLNTVVIFQTKKTLQLCTILLDFILNVSDKELLWLIKREFKIVNCSIFNRLLEKKIVDTKSTVFDAYALLASMSNEDIFYLKYSKNIFTVVVVTDLLSAMRSERHFGLDSIKVLKISIFRQFPTPVSSAAAFFE